MRSLRFCHVTTFYPPYNFGGDGITVQRLCRGLARRGHHVTVVHDADAYNFLHRGREPELGTEPEGIRRVALKSGAGTLSQILIHQLGRPVITARRIGRLMK